MTNYELQIMHEGNFSRHNGTFSDWPQEDVERYWAAVHAFDVMNQESELHKGNNPE